MELHFGEVHSCSLKIAENHWKGHLGVCIGVYELIIEPRQLGPRRWSERSQQMDCHLTNAASISRKRWPFHATAEGTSETELWCSADCLVIFQIVLRVIVSVICCPGRKMWAAVLLPTVVVTSRNQVWFYAEIYVVSIVQLRPWTVGESSLLQAPWLWVVCAEQENHHPLQELEGDWNSSWAQGSIRTDWFVAFVAKLCMQSTIGKCERWYFMPERESKGQERSAWPSCYLERDFKLEVSSLIDSQRVWGQGLSACFSSLGFSQEK